MTYSPLCDVVINSPNHSGQRTMPIDVITIHCMAGNLSVESCGNWFKQPSAQASSNYGIDTKGRIGGYVPEEYRSWCTSSKANDQRAITIEVANTSGAPDYPVSDKALKSLIMLCADICKRNNIKELLWKADNTLLWRVDLQNMTAHRWFAQKACPGNYLYSRFGYIADEVNKRLKGSVNMTDADKVVVRQIVQEEVAAALQRNNPLFVDIADVPPYWRDFIQELLDKDILNGGTPRDVNDHDVNLHQDTLKAIVLLKQYFDEEFDRRFAAATPTRLSFRKEK